jgi:hypothetical protein
MNIFLIKISVTIILKVNITASFRNNSIQVQLPR